jgi:hypothetical protein
MKKSERAAVEARAQYVLGWGAASISDGQSPEEFNETAWRMRSSLEMDVAGVSASSAAQESQFDAGASSGGPTVEWLRTMPYAEYLQTEHWQQVRQAALTRAEYRCQVCNSPYHLQVHHRTYERRGEERDTDLTVLCDTCHGRFHREGHLYAGSPSSRRRYTSGSYRASRFTRARRGRREPAYGAFIFGAIAAIVVLLIAASIVHAHLEFPWNDGVYRWWF